MILLHAYQNGINEKARNSKYCQKCRVAGTLYVHCDPAVSLLSIDSIEINTLMHHNNIRKSVGLNLADFAMIPKARPTQQIDKVDFIKTKTFCVLEDTIEEVKR